MGRWASQAAPARGVLFVMRPRNPSSIPAHSEHIDGATLYLCRQGRRWVVVIESPRYQRRRVAHPRGPRRSRRPAPPARPSPPGLPRRRHHHTDGALTAEDYEWRIEVRGVVAHPGDLGVGSARRALAGSRPTRPAAADGRRPLPLGSEPVGLGSTAGVLIRREPTLLNRRRAVARPSRWCGTSHGARPSSR